MTILGHSGLTLVNLLLLSTAHVSPALASTSSIPAGFFPKPVPGDLIGKCMYNPSFNTIEKRIHITCPSSVGEAPANSADVFPWTHKMLCVSKKLKEEDRKNPHKIPEIPRIHCLHSSDLFGGGHGTSIITTSEAASNLIAGDAMEDRPWYGSSKKRVFAPGPIVSKEGPAYTTKQYPGKGMGVMALRKIEQGEILMLDLPALIVGKQFLEDIEPRLRRRMLRRAVAQLPKNTQEMVAKLGRSTGGEVIDDILGTNSCSFSLGEREMHLGLFPEVARLNHACNPNAYYRFSPHTAAMEVVAYRDIQRGEEITISYTHLSLSRTDRRQSLKNDWNIDCQCSLCRASATETTESEDRRKDIKKFQGKLAAATREGRYTDALAAADELMGLTAAEGVTPLMPEMHDMLAAIALDMGDYAGARRWGKLALDGWEKFDSVDETQIASARWFMSFIEERKAYDEEVAAQKAREEEEMNGDA